MYVHHYIEKCLLGGVQLKIGFPLGCGLVIISGRKQRKADIRFLVNAAIFITKKERSIGFVYLSQIKTF